MTERRLAALWLGMLAACGGGGGGGGKSDPPPASFSCDARTTTAALCADYAAIPARNVELLQGDCERNAKGAWSTAPCPAEGKAAGCRYASNASTKNEADGVVTLWFYPPKTKAQMTEYCTAIGGAAREP